MSMRKLQTDDKLLINEEAAGEFNSRQWNVFGKKIYRREIFYKGWERGNILSIGVTNDQTVTVYASTSFGTTVTKSLARAMRQAYLRKQS